MVKWIKLVWHRLTSETVGEYLAKALALVEKEYAVARAKARDFWMIDNATCHRLMTSAGRVYKRDTEALDALAEYELAQIEREVEILHARATALLDAGANMAERTIDALCLHAHLANAVEKAAPPVKSA